MHKSMEILMARMDSHPEEFNLTNMGFLEKPTRWDFLIRPLLDRCDHMARGEPSFHLGFLSDAEVNEVFHKLMSVQGDHYTKRILSELLES